MPRLVRLIAVLSVVGISAPALACRTGGGVGIQLGSLFVGFSRHNHGCPPVVLALPAQALPPVAYYTQPQIVYVQPPQQQVVYVQPQVAYTPPPMIYAQPPVVYGNAPVVQAKVAPPPNDRPGFLALKYIFSSSEK